MNLEQLLPHGAFDFFTSVPTAERVALEIRSWGSHEGYATMFGERWSSLLGLPPDAVRAVTRLGANAFMERATEILGPYLPDVSDVAARLRRAGISRAVVHAPLPTDIAYPIDATAQLASIDPSLFVGFARIDPTEPARAAVRDLGHAVENLGMRGMTITPFWHGLPCDDRDLDPLFGAAADLGAVAWIHTSNNWSANRPMDIEHPRHIDSLAARHPRLRIVCGHAGWPWVAELVAVAWRHSRVTIDFSAYRPRHIHTPGSGWETLAYYGERTVSRKIVFGTTWSLLGLEPESLLREAAAVPWPENVKRRWLHDNAKAIIDGENGEEP